MVKWLIFDLQCTEGVEVGAEAVEKVAETVESVAEEVEKMAEDVSQKLPEGGKVKQMVGTVINVAQEAAKDAKLVDDMMDKVLLLSYFFLRSSFL